jgi:type III pantothenate kinase
MVSLIIDIGNTAIKAACFNGDVLLKALRTQSFKEEEVEEMFLKLLVYAPDKAVIGSVGNRQKEVQVFLKRAKIPFTIIDSRTEIPLRNRYETPETLGIDRIANVIAASKIFPKKPILVIDAGTCIKFDFITQNEEYFGGSISPGIDMRFRALHEFTEKLPLLGRAETIYLIGKNTTEAIQSGVINGAVAEVKGILEQYQMTHKDLEVIVTGGDAAILERNLKSSNHPEPWLTLKGLNEIHLYNAI